MTPRGYKAFTRSFLLAAVATLLVASGANASTYGSGRPFGEAELAAVAQAETFWGRQPELCTSRTMEVVAPGALGASNEWSNVGGRATMPKDDPAPCGMWIEEDALGASLCSLIRHEYGHWLGLGHEDPELAEMPNCEAEREEAKPEPGIYIPPPYAEDPVSEAWSRWRLHRRWCKQQDSGSFARQKCFRVLRRYAERLRRRYY